MSNQATTRATSANSGVGRAPGFQRAAASEPIASNIDVALARNRAFAAAGGHEGATPLATLRLFVITCLDPRTDPAHVLGLGMSDAFVVRNVGGRVNDEVINDVAFVAQIAEQVAKNVNPDGREPLFEVAVIHHNECGAMALSNDEFRATYADRIGTDESELRDHAVLDPAATVATDVARLRGAPAIPDRVLISGHVYDVTTGLVHTILPAARRTTQTSQPPESPEET
jgi:carbonic anhydrase